MKPGNKLTIFTFILCWMLVLSFSVSAEDQLFVSPEVHDRLSHADSVDLIVHFKGSPDLSRAHDMGWSERGHWVHDQMSAASEQAQQALRAQFGRSGTSYQVLENFNMMVIPDADYSVLDTIVADLQVKGVFVRPDFHLLAIEQGGDLDGVRAGPRGIEPNIDQIKASDVWNDLGVTGEGAVIGINDTVPHYTHDALVNQYRGHQGGNDFDHDYAWYFPGSGHPVPPLNDHYHGSHVAGIAVGDDGADNQIGVAPGAKWMACGGCLGGSCPQVTQCLNWFVAPTDVEGNNPDPDMRPHVVNNSWGNCAQAHNESLYGPIFDAMLAAGVIPVFSNGNNNSFGCGYPAPPGLNTVGDPARHGRVLGIGSTTRSGGNYATHSNWGPTDHDNPGLPGSFDHFGYPDLKPNVSAPGASIRSAGSDHNSNYITIGGTSMASPHAAGVIALMVSAAPSLAGDNATIGSILQSTANHVEYAGGGAGNPDVAPGVNHPNYASGWGEIDALAAVTEALVYAGGTGTITGLVTDANSDPIEGVRVDFEYFDPPPGGYATMTDAAGEYSQELLAVGAGEGYNITFSKFGYVSQVETGVEVADEQVVTVSVSLEEADSFTLSGTVTDSETDFPLAATITFPGTPVDPLEVGYDGNYSIELPGGIEYQMVISANASGYQVGNETVDPLTADTALDIELDADLVACSAPGYSVDITNYFSEDFEADDGGFTTSGNPAPWQWGTPISWPAACAEGDNCWGTNLSGNYNNGANETLSSPAIDLSGISADAVMLRWDQANHVETHNWDQAFAEISIDGGPWTVLWQNPGSTVAEGWRELEFDISDAAGGEIELRWRLVSDGSVNYPGLYIDNLRVESQDCLPGNPPALIDVDTASLHYVVAPGNVENANVNITNWGGEDLEFWIEYLAVAGAGQRSTVLWEQPANSSNGIISGYSISDGDGGYSADDFVLDAPSTIETMFVEGFRTNGPLTDAEYITWYIFADNGGQPDGDPETDPGAAVFTFTAAPDDPGVDVTDGNIHLDLVAASGDGVQLNAGTYWISVVPAFDFPIGVPQTRWNWFTGAPALGEKAKLISPQLFGEPDWTDIDALTGEPLFAGLAFTLTGSAGVCEEDAPSWLSVAPDSGTLTAQGGTQDLAVTIDTTGLDEGLHQAGLCINSDAANSSIVAVPISVLVTTDPIQPVADVNPASLTFNAVEGDTASQALNIDNPGNLPLDWTIEEDVEPASNEPHGNSLVARAGVGAHLNAACDAPSDIPWLALSSYSGTTPAFGSRSIDVMVDSSGLTEGLHEASLCVSTNDPDHGLVIVPVALEVIDQANYAIVEGTVESLGYCGENPSALAGASVEVLGAFNTFTATTDASGYFSVGMHFDQGPVVVNVTAAGHQGDSESNVELIGDETTTVDFGLIMDGVCATVEPAVLDLQVIYGTVEDFDLTIGNLLGTIDLDWAIETYRPSQRDVPVTALSEDFEGAFPPADWTVTDEGTGCVWISSDDAGMSGWSGTDRGAAVDADQCGSGTSPDTSLITPSMDLTGLVGTELYFDMAYRHLGSELSVDVTTDGGDTWTNIESWTANYAYSTDPHLPVVLDLSDYDDEPDVQIRWRFTSGWGWWAFIDNVRVGEPPASCENLNTVPWLSVPASGTVAGGSESLVPVSIDATNLAFGDYSAALCIETSDDNAPAFEVPVNVTVNDPSNGFFMGNVTGQMCGEDPFALEGAVITIEGATETYTTETDENGDYFVLVHEDDSPVDVTVSHAGYLSESDTGISFAGTDIVELDYNLTIDAGCIDVTPDELAGTVDLGSTLGLDFEVANFGASALEWSILDPSSESRESDPLIGFNFTTATSADPDPQNWQRIGEVDGLLDEVYDDTGALTGIHFEWGGVGASQGPLYLNSSTLAADAVPMYDYDLSGMTGYGFRSGGRLFIELSNLQPNADYEYWMVAYRAGSGFDNAVEVSYGDDLGAIQFSQTITTAQNGGRFVINDQHSNDSQDFNELSFVTRSSPNGTIRIEWEGDTDSTVVIGAFAIRQALDCDLPGWLSAAPDSGTIGSGDPSQTVTATLDPTGMAPGEYEANLCFASNDPLNPVVEVPVTMTAELPATWGTITGTVSSLGHCSADPYVLAGANVDIVGNMGSYSVVTDENGYFETWLPEGESPLSISASAEGHHSDSISVNFSGGDEVTADIDLLLDAACAAVMPEEIAVSIDAGTSTSGNIELNNYDGNATLIWSIDEAPGLAGSTDPRAHFPYEPVFVEHKNDANVSAGLDPWQLENQAQSEVGNGLLDAFEVPAYSTTGYTASGYITMDAVDPATMTVINANQPTNIYAGTFVDNDLNTHYVLSSDGGDLPAHTLGTIDVATGDFTALGTVTGGIGTNWAGLAWDHTTRTLFGMASNTLFTIDLDTLTANPVGPISGPGMSPSAVLVAMAISPEGLMYAIDIADDVLIAVDKTTGDAAVIGSLGVDANFAQDMDFDQSTGTLYWPAYMGGGASSMYTIDTATAQVTLIGPIASGDEMLSFTIAVPGAGDGDVIVQCQDPQGIPWLSATPSFGVNHPGTASTINVGLDATDLQPGEYHAGLCIASNDPVNPILPVPVSLNVRTPTDWGHIEGTVTSLGYCSDAPAPLEGAQIVVTGSNGSYTETTDADGNYSLSAPDADAPYEVTVTHPDHLSASQSGVTPPATVDFDLVLDAACATVDPEEIVGSSLVGGVDVQTLTIGNLGVADLNWDILFGEAPDGVVLQPLGEVTEISGAEPSEQVQGLASAGTGIGQTVVYPFIEPQRGDTTITHSSSLGITPLNTVACFNQGSGWSLENQFLRTFVLDDFGLDGGFDVSEVTFGIETLSVNMDITVNLYTLEGAFTYANMTLIGTTTQNISAQDETLVTVPVEGSAPAGSTLVVEIAAPSQEGIANARFFAGSNNAGQTAPSYLASEACGSPEPSDYAALGFPEVQLVMTVTGSTGGSCAVGTDIPWLSTSPTSGTVAGGDSTTVDVLLDASGLAPGTYEAELCVNSNDASNPLISVPVTFDVLGSPDDGILEGTVSSLGYCSDDPAVLEGALIEVEGSLGGTFTTTTDADGFYQLYIDAGESPITVSVSADEHLGDSVSGIGLVAQETTVVDFDLVLEAGCTSHDPDRIDVQVNIDGNTSRLLSLINDGALDSSFSITNVEQSTDLVDHVIERAAVGARSVADDGSSRASGEFVARPAEVREVTLRVRQDDLAVVVLSPDTTAPANLLSDLNGFPGITAELYPGNLGTITGADLAGYDIAVLTNNNQWQAIGANVSVGDALADFIDDGGKAVVFNYAYDDPTWGFQLDGRFITDGYGPFLPAIGEAFSGSTMVMLDPDHPILEGVSSLSNGASAPRINNPLQPDATLIAEWADGFPLIAYNENVVAVNALYSSDGTPGDWTGDLDLIAYNAISFIATSAEPAAWLSFDPEFGTVPAGSSSNVNVLFDADGLPEGLYAADILVDVDEGGGHSQQLTVPVTMEVLPLDPSELGVDPAALDFGEVLVDADATQSFSVTNLADAGSAALVLTDLELSGDVEFSISGGDCALGTVLEPGESCLVEISFAPGAVAAFTGEVTIATHDEQATVALSGNGVVLDPGSLELTPAEHDFGVVMLGDSSSFEFTVTNNAPAGHAAVTVDSLSVVGSGDFADSGNGSCELGTTALEPGESCTVEIVYTPSAVGGVLATLLVEGTGGEIGSATMMGTGSDEEPPVDDQIFSDRFEG